MKMTGWPSLGQSIRWIAAVAVLSGFQAIPAAAQTADSCAEVSNPPPVVVPTMILTVFPA